MAGLGTPAINPIGSGGGTSVSIVGPLGSKPSAASVSVVISSDQAAIPVTGSFSIPGVATAANQTGGTQKTQVVDGSGNVIGSTGNALDINIKSGNLTTLPVTNAGTFTVQVNDGTNTANVIAGDTGFNGLSTGSVTKTIPFTTSASGAQTLLANTLIAGYTWIEVITTAVGSGLAWNGVFSPNSGGTYNAVNAWYNSTGSNPIGNALGTSNNVVHWSPVHGDYFQLAISALTSGTVSGYVILHSGSFPFYPIIGAVQNGAWSVGSNSPTGSAVPANAFYIGASGPSGNLTGIKIGSQNGDADGNNNSLTVTPMIFNGTNYDRVRDVINATNSVGTGIQAAGILAQFDDVSPTAITENQFGNMRMSANRNLYGTIRDAAGNERGLNINANNAAMVAIDQTTPGTTNAISLAQIGGTTIVNGGVAGSQSIGGTVATNVAITANPVNLGVQAVSSENSAVTTARQVQLVADLVGKLIVLPFANPENFVNGTTAAITDTTTTSIIASAGGSLRNYITDLTVTNSHPTVGTFVKITDGASTILWEGYAAAAGGGFAKSFSIPLRGTAATAVNAICVTTGANVIVSAAGYKGI